MDVVVIKIDFSSNLSKALLGLYYFFNIESLIVIELQFSLVELINLSKSALTMNTRTIFAQ